MLVLALSVCFPSPQFIWKENRGLNDSSQHTHTKDLLTFQSKLQYFLSPAVSGSLFTPKVKADLESVCQCGCERVHTCVRYFSCHSSCRDLMLLPSNMLPLLSLTEGDETGVMDSLMEALQSGAAFRDRRKRTPRNGTVSQTTSLLNMWHQSAQMWLRLLVSTTGIWVSTPSSLLHWSLLHTSVCVWWKLLAPVRDWIWWPVSVVSSLPLLFYCHHHCRRSESFQSSLSVAVC